MAIFDSSQPVSGLSTYGLAAIASGRTNGTFARTADLGALDDAARCHEGPVWGSRAAATVSPAKVGSGPVASVEQAAGEPCLAAP